MIDDLLSLARSAVDQARLLGADAAEAVATDGRSTEIEILHGKIEKVEQAEARVLALKVYSGKSSASLSGKVLTGEAIRRLAETGLAMARQAPPDPFAGIADPDQLATAFPDLDLVSGSLPDAGRLEQLALEAEAAALGVEGVSKSGGAGASVSDRSMAMAISNGFARGYRRTGSGFSVSAIAGDGTAMQRDYDYSSAVHFADLRPAAKVGREAGMLAARRRNPRKVKSQAVPVIYDRRVSSGLIGHLLGAISGSAVARGTSFLKDRLGTEVFGRHITIVDDPLRRRGHGSRPFDGDGLGVHRRHLVADGRLTGWLLDLRSARQLGIGLGTGGNGVDAPGTGATNVHMVPGTASPQDLIGRIGQGLLVTELLGSSIDMVTGDYSRGASGFWIDNGAIAYPVSEITIAGNLMDMFRNIHPASDLEFRGSVNAPTCLVEGLTIAGL